MSDSLHVSRAFAVTDAFARARADAEEFATYALSEGTRDVYRRAFAIFTDRCVGLGVTPLPCPVDGLIAVIGSLGKEGARGDRHRSLRIGGPSPTAADPPEARQRGLSDSRIGVILAAVSKAHRLADLADPTTSERVRMVLMGIKRNRAGASHRKQALHALPGPEETRSELVRLVVPIPDTTLPGRRDRALILLGFAAALRRSELCGLDCADVEFTDRGVIVHIRRSKGDQDAKGQRVMVPFGTEGRCPVAALRLWLTGADLTGGRLFRAIDRHGNLADTLSPQAVALIVKKRLKAAGLDAAKFSAHSLRSGFLTSAADNGASVWDLMGVSRHKDIRTLQAYVQRREGFDDYPGKGVI